MSRELASPDLGNLIAARIAPAKFEARVGAPLSQSEADDVAELFDWFTRRYPTARDRLAYVRGKLRQYAKGRGAALGSADYLATATRLAQRHRENDPQTMKVLLDPDPEENEIRLIEITRSAPTTGQPFAVGFMARPDLGVPFPSSVLLLSPDEWEDVRSGRLPLEPGWSLERCVPV